MNCAVQFEALCRSESCTTEQALAFFDSLEPADIEFMLGRWRGEGFATGHPMDGLLEAFDWYGKAFHSPDHVDPLIFRGLNDKLVTLDPAFFPLKYARSSRLTASPWANRLFKLSTLLTRTKQSRARLRMLEYRGVSSATMIYDHLPINDTFRKIDQQTVMGVMDLKGVNRPFFFVLHRD